MKCSVGETPARSASFVNCSTSLGVRTSFKSKAIWVCDLVSLAMLVAVGQIKASIGPINKIKVAIGRKKVSSSPAMDADELRTCIEQHEKNQSQIASDLGISSSGMSKWVNGSRKIDERDEKLLRLYFYGEIPFDDIRPTQDLSHILKFSEKEWEIIGIIATRNGRPTGEWIAGQIRDYLSFRTAQFQASELKEQEPANVTRLPRPLPKKQAAILASAGTEESAIECDVGEWDMVNGTAPVRIVGLSMEPVFHDDQVITIRHKAWSRSPYMKKGLIYLVRYNDGYMLKRYQTRKARPDEKDAEYLTNTGRVGVLESLNPDFPDIDITGPFDWEGWYDEEK